MIGMSNVVTAAWITAVATVLVAVIGLVQRSVVQSIRSLEEKIVRHEEAHDTKDMIEEGRQYDELTRSIRDLQRTVRNG